MSLELSEFSLYLYIYNYIYIYIFIYCERSELPSLFNARAVYIYIYIYIYIIESVDSISKDERGLPLTQYITNGRISRDGYTFTHFKHDHRVLLLISYSISV